MELISNRADYSGKLGDKRLERRAELLSNALTNSRTSVVHKATRDEAEQKGFYRFLNNDAVSEEQLIEALRSRCATNVQGRDVLVIEDSSSLGFSHQAGNIKENSGMGLVGNKKGLGFLSHVSLVLDAHSEAMLGFCDVQLWHRIQDKANNTTRVYKKQPIEQKESYKWIKASKQAKDKLSSANSMIIIQDREGDLYEQFCEIADGRTKLIIRNRDDRKLTRGGTIKDWLASVETSGCYSIAIIGDKRKDRIKRIARLEVKYSSLTIQKPQSAKTPGLPAGFTLNVVEAKEVGYSGKDAIYWRLLTTCAVDCLEQAVAIIKHYSQRWYIEQVFRLLKKQGYQIEASQLQTGWAIRKLFVMTLSAVLRVMQLYLAYGEESSQNIEEVFDEQEIECLQAIQSNHLPQTAATSNLNDRRKLSWASWIIARLGGWKGNVKQKPPGPIIFKRGLDRFNRMFDGWKLAREMTADVSKP